MGVYHSKRRLFAAYRGSKNTDFNQNITYQPSMMRRVFLSVFFTSFFRLQVYKAIAAIFWQSASYVTFKCTLEH